mgnify:CR=1 FL=1
MKDQNKIPNEGPKGVGGWLSFVIIALTILIPLGVLARFGIFLIEVKIRWVSSIQPAAGEKNVKLCFKTQKSSVF